MNLTHQPVYLKAQKRPKKANDDAYLLWLSHQPSAIDRDWNQRDPHRNIPCHVRRLKWASGAGYKPKGKAIPLTDKQHQVQTNFGEAACLNLFHPSKRIWTVEEAGEWFEEKALAYAQAYKEAMGDDD